MKRQSGLALGLFLISWLLLGTTPAFAHQPVVLLPTDTTAIKGPLLTDGTISFALRANFTKSGEKRGFRAVLKSGDKLKVEYLIFDKKPDNIYRSNQLPSLKIISPQGKSVIIQLNERTKFYEPFSKTNYLFLARYSEDAVPGIYEFLITSRGRANITIAVGDKEIAGEVIRGAVPTTSPSAQTTQTPSPSPSATKSNSNEYTLDQVKARNSATSCWSVIDGYVYDLTNWISSHPGGPAAIRSLCGIDGTSAFLAQHEGQKNPINRLAMYRLGPLKK